jgi:hypothetical protein
MSIHGERNFVTFGDTMLGFTQKQAYLFFKYGDKANIDTAVTQCPMEVWLTCLAENKFSPATLNRILKRPVVVRL